MSHHQFHHQKNDYSLYGWVFLILAIVLIVGVSVYYFSSKWPDLIVAMLMSALSMSASLQIFRVVRAISFLYVGATYGNLHS